jgi:hypothetical protein
VIPFGRLENVHRLMGNPEAPRPFAQLAQAGIDIELTEADSKHSAGSFTRALESSVEGSPTRRRQSTGHEVPLDGRRQRRH